MLKEKINVKKTILLLIVVHLMIARVAERKAEKTKQQLSVSKAGISKNIPSPLSIVLR